MDEPTYNYKMYYNQGIEEELVNILEKMKPVTLIIKNKGNTKEQNIFSDYINDNYYHISKPNIYLRKDYFLNQKYIVQQYDHSYNYYEYDEDKGMYKSTPIDEQKIKECMPILFASIVTDYNISGCEIKKIDNKKFWHWFILKEKPMHTKKAITNKNENQKI